MDKFTPLLIRGFQDLPLPNRFYRQEPAATRLAILFPGLGYNPDLPLLYYTQQLLLAHGVDLLQLRPEYATRAFQSLSNQEQFEVMAGDAAAALQAGLAQGDYQQVILAGKSIGTLSMALLLPQVDLPLPPITIWLTPLLRQAIVVDAALDCQAPAFYLVGSSDPTYVPATMSLIQKRTPAQVFVAEGANHSLEIPGETVRSLDILRQGMGELSSFLAQALEG